MYGCNNTSCNNYSRISTTNDFSSTFSGDFLEHSLVPAALQVDCLMIPNNEFDSVSATLMMTQQLCDYTTSSKSSSYGSPTSHTSYEAQPSSYMMQTSVSSHALHKNMNGFRYHQQITQFSGYGDSSNPVRKAVGTGDLERNNMVQQHHRSESPLSNESSIIECMNAKACKYSPEEKKEKIEKYRSKRNQRNYNKKIKYECRKTLADSRPRIRGRFAKNNDENEKGGQPIDEWNHIAADNHGDFEEDHQNWINFVDAFSANVIP